ncbi:diaminopimelate epimerase [Conexibacter woesei]|uniref:Diaminopimelate epimerase n=1 Tax=Conexibacter woesei (strain DSM 14684 / CCUG 47730 / CIP 108061 / JCM 11494 / NBRC 100937 / ID131577) TaxID=469383 RepID=D3FE58_CONWI|nr:diaminopimelate epimerase [Conexibacter woesei]ADB51674.1 diaminopimelate epimerase [Conexibacter woesei DSM 14684]
MKFEKWQALGNDYAIVEQRDLPFELTPARIRAFCAGHFGVFADGILLLSESDQPGFVADLKIYNPDGSEAELSGNGAREAIMYLRQRGWTDADEFSIQTAAGEIRPTITGPATCKVDMGRAKLTSKDFPSGPDDGRAQLTAGQHQWSFQHVSIGNPQCSIRVDSLEALDALDLPAIGGAIEHHERFPNRTNVSWYAELAPDRIRARIFERGVGETLSSGTGATGAAVAHVLRGGGGDDPDTSTVTVVLDGGELEVEVAEDLHVNLTGWAVPVFGGTLSETFLKELHETE